MDPWPRIATYLGMLFYFIEAYVTIYRNTACRRNILMLLYGMHHRLYYLSVDPVYASAKLALPNFLDEVMLRATT